MTREELIAHIREAMKTEESAVAIYARHIAAIVTKSGLPEAKAGRIEKALNTLIDENKKHKKFLESLMKRVQGESIDVY